MSAPPYERQIDDDPPPYVQNSDKEALTDPRFDFNDDTIRRGFIRKVYSILMCQLTVTTAMVAVFKWHPQTHQFVYEAAPQLFGISLLITFPVLIILSCFRDVARKSPTNLILLFVFTCGMSVIVGLGTITYDDVSVLMALGLTALVCFGLTLFAFQTKYDLTSWGGILYVGLLILLVAGFVSIFIPTSDLPRLFLAGAGVFLFSLYLIYDTQLMLGGNHKYAISPEEYIFAAINLYLDVLNLFIRILQIVGAVRGRN